MPKHTSLSEENDNGYGSEKRGNGEKGEYITDNLINSESVVKRRCKKWCLIIYLFGYSVPLVLGFFIGYRYKADNCDDSFSY